PYWAIDAGPVRIIGIDTGLLGVLDAEQGAWLSGRRGPAGAAVAPLARVAGDVDEPVAVGSPPAGEGHAWRYCGQSRGREWVP
ncbi:hypothetical protein ABT383_10155, partial [Streptomyces humidus]|uniref:hypothetical protein n=1 Tax=Streptomyces humidus TaxID=52259 RepID=UPI0033171577